MFGAFTRFWRGLKCILLVEESKETVMKKVLKFPKIPVNKIENSNSD